MAYVDLARGHIILFDPVAEALIDGGILLSMVLQTGKNVTPFDVCFIIVFFQTRYQSAETDKSLSREMKDQESVGQLATAASRCDHVGRFLLKAARAR